MQESIVFVQAKMYCLRKDLEQVEEVWAEACEGQPSSSQLLQMHIPRVLSAQTCGEEPC